MLNRVKNSLLVRNTLSTFIGMGTRIGIQAVYFVLIARTLGNDGYGAFIGAMSLVALLFPFASLGAGNLLIKNVSRNPELFPICWGNAVVTTLVSGTLLIALVALLSSVLLPESIPLHLVLLVAISDILFARLLDVSGQAYQAFQRLSRTAQLQVLFSGSRLLSALVLIAAVSQPEPQDWGWFYLLSTAISCIIAVTLVCWELGMPKPEIRRIPSEIKEGFYFAVSLSSQSIYNDLDKTMLARFSTLEAAGIFAAAHRIVDVAFTPVSSLLAAAYARFFQHGVSGIRGGLEFAKRLLPVSAGYGIIVGTVIYLIAPLVPTILGREYDGSVEAIRWLAVIPFLRSIHYFAADTLTGSGYQGIRSGVQVFVTIVSVVINTLLIPVYSWKGAAIAVICSNTLLAIGLWGAVGVLHSKNRTKDEIRHLAQVGEKS